MNDDKLMVNVRIQDLEEVKGFLKEAQESLLIIKENVKEMKRENEGLKFENYLLRENLSHASDYAIYRKNQVEELERIVERYEKNEDHHIEYAIELENENGRLRDEFERVIEEVERLRLYRNDEYEFVNRISDIVYYSRKFLKENE